VSYKHRWVCYKVAGSITKAAGCGTKVAGSVTKAARTVTKVAGSVTKAAKLVGQCTAAFSH